MPGLATNIIGRVSSPARTILAAQAATVARSLTSNAGALSGSGRAALINMGVGGTIGGIRGDTNGNHFKGFLRGAGEGVALGGMYRAGLRSVGGFMGSTAQRASLVRNMGEFARNARGGMLTGSLGHSGMAGVVASHMNARRFGNYTKNFLRTNGRMFQSGMKKGYANLFAD